MSNEKSFAERLIGKEVTVTIERPDRDDVKWFDVASDIHPLVGLEELVGRSGPVSVSIGYRGPFPVCPEEEVATHLEWDMFMPSGLVSVVPDDPKPRDIYVVGGRGDGKSIGRLLAGLAYAGVRTILVTSDQREMLLGCGIPDDILAVVPHCRPAPLVEVNPVNTYGGFSPRSRAGKAHRWR